MRLSQKTISKHDRALITPALWPPVLGICGYSGSGKTTMIERLVPRLTARGLNIAVIKHDAHRLQFDTPGKDTDRIYRSGADVLAHDPQQTILRLHGTGTLEDVLRLLPCRYDLVLVEGHKASPVAKLWLSADPRCKLPAGTTNVLKVLTRTDDVIDACESEICTFLSAYCTRLPTWAAVLRTNPPTAPTHRKRLNQCIRRVACEIFHFNHGGHETARRLSADHTPAQLAALHQEALRLLRGNPFVRWILLRDDLPPPIAQHLPEFVHQSGPGRWIVVPRLQGWNQATPVPPLLVCIPPGLAVLEQALSNGHSIASHPRVLTVPVPS